MPELGQYQGSAFWKTARKKVRRKGKICPVLTGPNVPLIVTQYQQGKKPQCVPYGCLPRECLKVCTAVIKP